jgi:acyl-homoserine-lactone acylase
MKLAVILCAAAMGLVAAPRQTEILWDSFGVAHVYAKTKQGMFFGYGYAQMQSHANLILKLYGESRGRGAEYWGPSALELDKWVHLNEVPARAEKWFQQQTPEFQEYLNAFADGMNEYARRHPEAIGAEYKQVLPIRPVDSLMHVHRIVHFSYVSAQARTLALAAGRPIAASPIGSNAWAIMPKKSANGTPMMLMNPHLPWQDWYTYYEVHLNGPGINLYGGSQVGFPVLRFVFSDYLGFTQTVNSIDASDLYKITPDGDGYRFDGARKAYERAKAVIKVKGGADVTLEIKKTVHGPVVWDQGGRVIAMRTGGLDRPFLLEQYWKMAIAKNFKEYQEQVKRLEVPTFNITYADRDGHVMYLFNGTLPKRKSGDLSYWAGVVPGDTSETLWTEYHSYAELPKTIDPPAGWVQNTNDPPWTSTLPALDPAAYPPYAAGTNYSMRTNSSLRMLSQPEKLTFEKMVENKHSTHLELADRMLDDLLAATPDSPAKKVLAGWDRNADNGSVGAILFEVLMRDFKPEWKIALNPKDPLRTPMGLKNAAAGAEALAKAAAEVQKKFGRLDVAYGEVTRLKFKGADLPGNGAGGALGAFRVISYGPQRTPIFGDSFVTLVEWQKSGPRAQSLVSYGNSSQPGTKHAADQIPFLSQKKLREAWRLRKDVEKHLESKDVF